MRAAVSFGVLCGLAFSGADLHAHEFTAKPRGWSTDGRYFAYEQTDTRDCKAPGGRCHWTHGVIVDVTTLRSQVFLIDAFIEWERYSPKPVVTKEAFADALRVRSVAPSEPKPLPARSSSQLPEPLRALPPDQRPAFPSPDGQRFATVRLKLADAGCEYYAPQRFFCRPANLAITAVSGLAVKLTGDDLLLLQNGDAILESLGRADAVTIDIARSTKQRQRSAIYGRAGFEKEAARIAAAIPGGASTELLTWEERAEIVVALGSSVLPDPQPVALAASGLTTETVFETRAEGLRVLGWSRDGRSLVLQAGASGCCDHPVAAWTTTSVVDTFTGERHDYLTQLELGSLTNSLLTEQVSWVRSEVDKLCPGCADRRAWETWRAANELTDPRWSRHQPGGRATANVLPAIGGGQWQEWYVWRPPEELAVEASELPRKATRFVGEIVVGGGRASSGTIPRAFALACDNGVGVPMEIGVLPTWSPDGRRLAWVIKGSAQAFGVHSYGLALAPVQGPHLQLVAVRTLAAPVVLRAREGLARAGFTVTQVSEATTDRAQTVVYVSDAFRAEGSAIAAAIPGGAKVEPLTWTPDADVVVALGASAK